VAAVWHHPLFSSGKEHGGEPALRPFWQLLYDADAEIVLSGHEHNYERFAPQDPSGTADAARGIRQFVVGTGGAPHYGFGAAAHLVTQVARYQGKRVFAFTRPGDLAAQAFARAQGAAWTGDSDTPAPEPLDAAIIFAPVGGLVPQALQAVRKGGRVICGGIHMSDIPTFPYRLLWEERELASVANLTRADARAFFAEAGNAGIHATTRRYPLEAANDALEDLRLGRLSGAAVLVP